MLPYIPKTANDGFAVGSVSCEHFHRGKCAVKLFRITGVNRRGKMDNAVFVIFASPYPATKKTVKGGFRTAFSVFLGVALDKGIASVLLA